MLREALNRRKKAEPENKAAIASAQFRLAQCLAAMECYEECELLYHGAAANPRAVWGDHDPRTLEYLYGQVQSLIRLKHLERAELLALHFYELTAAASAPSEAGSRASDLLVELYESWKRPTDAAAYRAQSQTTETP